MMPLLTIRPAIRGSRGTPALKKAMLTKMTLSRVGSATSEQARFGRSKTQQSRFWLTRNETHGARRINNP